jgi:small subunit ribosomal protein S16
MITLRLQRQGAPKKSFYRLIAVDKRISAASGKFRELLGNWDPHSNKITFKKERIAYWLKCGAQTSATVHNLLVRAKIIDAKKIAKVNKKKEPKKK